MALVSPKSAVWSLLLTVPFLILSLIAACEIEPWFTFLKISTPTAFVQNPIGFSALILTLALLPVAAYTAAMPMLISAGGGRKFYLINFILAAMILVYFAVFIGAWISEVLVEIS